MDQSLIMKSNQPQKSKQEELKDEELQILEAQSKKKFLNIDKEKQTILDKVSIQSLWRPPSYIERICLKDADGLKMKHHISVESDDPLDTIPQPIPTFNVSHSLFLFSLFTTLSC